MFHQLVAGVHQPAMTGRCGPGILYPSLHLVFRKGMSQPQWNGAGTQAWPPALRATDFRPAEGRYDKKPTR